MGRELTIEDAQKALGVHALEKGALLREKYGKFIDYDALLTILEDREFVRFPTKIVFDSSKVDSGMFAVAERASDCADDGYVIYLHDYFKKKKGDVPALVLYHLVAINYGEFATFNDAELFASAALGMDQDYYYKYLCTLVDQMTEE